MIYYVTGIDTGIGKSYATGLMARYLLQRGVNVTTQKLVQTGNVGYSEDRDLHRRLMGVETLPGDAENWSAPAIFAFPASAHLAAELEKRTVDPDAIAAATAQLAARYDVVLVEGAGGLAVPLTRDLLSVDYMARYGYPTILVTSGCLGSINHTILSLEALAARKLPVAGLVYQLDPDADPVIAADSKRVMLDALAHYGYPRVLVEVPRIDPDDDFATPDFGALFTAEVRHD